MTTRTTCPSISINSSPSPHRARCWFASATEDLWADPKGEFLAAFHAGPVYRLLGESGLEQAEMPPPGQLVGNRVGYFLRPGKHDMRIEDWQAYLEMADRFLK